MGDQRDLLAGLDDVQWQRIVHFYGRASDIPQAIRAVGGPGREEATSVPVTRASKIPSARGVR
jgi:hypothetical protein